MDLMVKFSINHSFSWFQPVIHLLAPAIAMTRCERVSSLCSKRARTRLGCLVAGGDPVGITIEIVDLP